MKREPMVIVRFGWYNPTSGRLEERQAEMKQSVYERCDAEQLQKACTVWRLELDLQHRRALDGEQA